MQVINAYIHLLRTQGNMLSRQGGRCYLENTNLSQLIKADGEENHCMEERYPPKDGIGVPHMANRVLSYLDHEMVTTIYL
jgi:hypothetical protein